MYILVYNHTLEEYEVLHRWQYNSDVKRMQDLEYIKESDNWDYLYMQLEEYETYY